MRIVSTTCSNTEIVCALGFADYLVGVDRHSDYPEEIVNALPRVGKDLDIQVDKVAELKPDLVLASLTVPGHEKVVESLENAGLPVFAPEPVSLEDVYQDILDIGQRLGARGKADVLVARMRAEMPAVEFADESIARPRILVEWWPKPCIVPGRRSWVTDLIELAGGCNPWGEEAVKSRPLVDGEAQEKDPQAIAMSWCGVNHENYRAEEVYKRNWQVEAIRERRVVGIPEAYLGRPGPRLVEGYRSLRQLIESVV